MSQLNSVKLLKTSKRCYQYKLYTQIYEESAIWESIGKAQIFYNNTPGEVVFSPSPISSSHPPCPLLITVLVFHREPCNRRLNTRQILILWQPQTWQQLRLECHCEKSREGARGKSNAKCQSDTHSIRGSGFLRISIVRAPSDFGRAPGRGLFAGACLCADTWHPVFN